MVPQTTSSLGQYVASPPEAAGKAAALPAQGAGLLASLRASLTRAGDGQLPWPERARLLRQVSGGLDTYVMTCVGGLKRKMDSLHPAGQAQWEQVLSAMRAEIGRIVAEQAQCFHHMQPALEAAGVKLVSWARASAKQREAADEFYSQQVHPLLTPLAVDPGHPFPLISNLSLSLGVALDLPGEDKRIFCRVKIPRELPSWIALDSGPAATHYMPLTELIRARLGRLFHDMPIHAASLFRVTRTADFLLQRADTDDLLEMMADEAIRRRFEKVIRVEHEAGADAWILQFLADELELPPEDFFAFPSDYGSCDVHELFQPRA